MASRDLDSLPSEISRLTLTATSNNHTTESLQLESLPSEMLSLIVSKISIKPAGPLSEYYVPARPSPVTITRVATYVESIRSLRNICLLNKNFLTIDLANRISTLESAVRLDEKTGPRFTPVLKANPLSLAHYYNGIHNGMTGVDFVRLRLAFAFMSDWVFDQQALLNLPTPSSVFFIGVLALASNLKTLLIQYPVEKGGIRGSREASDDVARANQALMAKSRVFIAGRAELMCTASMNTGNAWRGMAPIQKLETVRFRRFLRKAEEDAPNDVPEWISYLMKLPQVNAIEIVGLCDAQLNPAVPKASVLPNGLRGILSHPQSFGLLQAQREEMGHDRIYSLPELHRLEHLEVDLHSLFGWARIWGMSDGALLRKYPDRANSTRVRDTIPTNTLKSLHLIENFTDLPIYLNLGAPAETTGIYHVNGVLAISNMMVDEDMMEDEFKILAAARRKVMTHVVTDLLELVQPGAFPSLRTFVYTPIAHARWCSDTRRDDALLDLAKRFAEAGVEMEIVYAGQLGRICQ
ncbi:hypothetical protein V8F06_004493 [Rhypophila decipiens]